MDEIPIVDFEKCGIHHAQVYNDDIQQIGQQIYSAFKNIGFVYLINTGIKKASIDGVNEVTELFFNKSTEEKAHYNRSYENFGYDCIGKERLGVKEPGDYKESFNMAGAAVVDDNVKWPDDVVPGFSKTAISFMRDCKMLVLRILESLSCGLQLKDSKLLSKLHATMLEANNHSSLRCLRYPPVPPCLKEGQVRLLEHTDYGSMTLLFQDDVGGLQIKTTEGRYIDAVPIEGSVLVNVADLLQYWTNGELRSTPHRILVPSDPVQREATRRSIAFFVHPSKHLLISDTLKKDDLKNNNVTLRHVQTDELQNMTVGEYAQRLFDRSYK